MAERGVEIDHATLNHWVIKFFPLIAMEAHKRKRKTAVSWRMDETYIKMNGKGTYYYRPIKKFGKPLISCCQKVVACDAMALEICMI